MSNTDNAHNRIIWVDCEMTGLDKVNDALIEVAVLVTDSELNILGEGVDVIIKPPDEAIAAMNDFVREMHTASGLIDELAAGLSMEEAEQKVLDYVRAYDPVPGKSPLGGNSVSTDRIFLNRDMPSFGAHLHYRTIDVSSVKELAHRWYPRAFYHAPEKTGNHRALGDIIDSINELKYYREVIFVPQPGPDSETAKAAAARIAASR